MIEVCTTLAFCVQNRVWTPYWAGTTPASHELQYDVQNKNCTVDLHHGSVVPGTVPI